MELSTMEFASMSSMPRSEEECTEKFGRNTISGNNTYCDAAWDSFLCWPATPAGKTVWRSCMEVLRHVDSPNIESVVLPQGAKAIRVCGQEGDWIWGNWTNYNECLNFTTTIYEGKELPFWCFHTSLYNQQGITKAPLTVSLILLVGSLISLFFLGLTIFIFFYFKSLQCSRLRVHRNLVLALIIHSLMLVIIALPVVGGPNIPSYRDEHWLCKSVLSIKMYAALASINWMFVEGMLLHSRITTNIFQKDAPFKLYYLIGWGIPLALILSWCTVMNVTMTTNCWEGYGKSPYVWIVTGPMIGALGVNLIFLINIVRILVTKMKTSSTFEIIQVRRAIKATALLFPLLGITHLLFCVNPRDDSKLEEAYMITNAALQSSQGIFVSILYCFMNTEVQIVLRKAYVRAALRRNPNHRYTWTCRGSTRASLSSTFVSNCESSIADSAVIRSSLSQKSGVLMRDVRQNDRNHRKFGPRSYNANGEEKATYV